MTSIPLSVGGRLISDTADLVRRYAGLSWSGGAREVWAWPYFDAVAFTEDDTVSAIDVLAAAVLHPGLSRRDFGFFVERAGELSEWLEAVPDGNAVEVTTLWFADDALLTHLDQLVDLADGINLTLLTKVLHRKRPAVVPLLDRHVIDRYRPITGERRPVEAWPSLVRAIRDDLASPEDRLVAIMAANQIVNEYEQTTGHTATLGLLRYLDIAVWMHAR